MWLHVHVYGSDAALCVCVFEQLSKSKQIESKNISESSDSEKPLDTRKSIEHKSAVKGGSQV